MRQMAAAICLDFSGDVPQSAVHSWPGILRKFQGFQEIPRDFLEFPENPWSGIGSFPRARHLSGRSPGKVDENRGFSRLGAIT